MKYSFSKCYIICSNIVQTHNNSTMIWPAAAWARSSSSTQAILNDIVLSGAGPFLQICRKCGQYDVSNDIQAPDVSADDHSDMIVLTRYIRQSIFPGQSLRSTHLVTSNYCWCTLGDSIRCKVFFTILHIH